MSIKNTMNNHREGEKSPIAHTSNSEPNVIRINIKLFAMQLEYNNASAPQRAVIIVQKRLCAGDLRCLDYHLLPDRPPPPPPPPPPELPCTHLWIYSPPPPPPPPPPGGFIFIISGRFFSFFGGLGLKFSASA